MHSSVMIRVNLLYTLLVAEISPAGDNFSGRLI